MKNIIVTLVLILIPCGMFSQELDSLKSVFNKDDSKIIIDDNGGPVNMIINEDSSGVDVKFMNRQVVKVIENEDTTRLSVGENETIRIIDQPDSTSIRVGNKEIKIVEKDDDTDISINRVYNDRDDKIVSRKFRGHWAGFEWGINNFMDNDNSISREGEAWFMDLNTGRSWAIHVNFAQYSLGFGTSHIGMLTGIGLEYNNYYFDNDITIIEEDDYVIVDTLEGDIAKSKLTTTFIRVPLIFEVQFPNTIRSKRVFLSAGIIAALKLGSHTKVVYKDDSGKNKDKNNDDFNINPFRYGLTARLGFGNLSIFGDYYFTQMFVKDKGPELHPFSVGLAFNF